MSYWNTRRTRRRFVRGLAAVGGAAALAPVLAACSGRDTDSGSGELASDQSVRYVDAEPNELDPGKASRQTEVQVISSVWEPLLSFDSNGSPVPLGATGWEISPDGVTYTFHVRDGVKWTDGSPITAHDYEWTWKRNEDPKLASDYAQALYNIKGAEEYNEGKVADPNAMGVKAIDDRTLQVTLSGPAAYFLRIASTWTAMPLPRTAIEKYGDKWIEAGRAVSNGPFKLDKWQHDRQIVLARNERYWGRKPPLRTITIALSSDFHQTSLPAYENSELDIAIGPWPADMDRINRDAQLSRQLHIFPSSATTFITCDTTNLRSPVSRQEVRQALYLAIDREKIASEVFKKVNTPAYTMLPADISGSNPGARISGGVKEANEALSSAGYPGGRGVAPMTLTYVQTADNDLLVQVLQQQWRESLGVRVDLNPMERKAYAELRKSWKTGHFDLTLGGWFSDYLDPFDWHNFLFKSDTDFYHSHWSSAEFDRLVSQAAVLNDPARRRELYQQAESILVREASQIPIHHPGTPYLIKPWVTGLNNDPTGIDRFTEVKILRH